MLQTENDIILQTENDMLNGTNAFAAKCIAGLPPITSTVAAIETLGLSTASAEMDRRKLLFLGSLCRASPQYVHKTIFISRLFACLYEETEKPQGFAADIVKLLHHYSLWEYLGNYLSTGYFPLDREWRKIVNKTVSDAVSEEWKTQLLNKPKLHRLARTHTKLEPLIHWEVSKRNPLNA